MDECRVCFICNHQNDVSFLVCEKCGGDLTGQPITRITKNDKEQDHGSEPLTVVSSDSVPKPNVNNDHVHCEEEKLNFGTSRPTTIMSQIKLVNQMDGIEILIPPQDCILGREGNVEPEKLQNYSRISRRHLKILFRNNNYIAEDISSNGTYKNGAKMLQGREFSLNEGDTLILADTSFEVMKG